ncbi:hypothetical protein PV327_009960 [Microctonus hyperodae]|uniref:Microtubule-associated protein n=1 Tax=Microctonus hyperodae TaxID=165561 RepID=A0AA39F226_MICHY|nr:hypothetical protein PV327_009960 [Microctonus hyperodae]
MESNQQHVNSNIVNKDLEQETIKRKPMSRNSNDTDDNDNDDDDVIIDAEKNPTSVDEIELSNINKSLGSKSPSPVPRSDGKFTTDEQPNVKMSAESSPVASNKQLLNEKLSPSQVDYSKTPEREIAGIENKDDNLLNNENDVVDDAAVVVDSKARKSPSSLKLDGKSSDTLNASPIPTSLSPSPDPMIGVMGFDNGKLRSLSPKSIKSLSSGASSPVPTVSKTPEVLSKNAEPKKNKTNFPDNIELNKIPQSTVANTEMREKLSPSRAQTPNPSMKRSTSGRSIKSDAGKNNGVNPIVQATTPTTNGVSPTKKLPTQLKDGEKSKSAGSPVKSPSKSIKSLPRTPDSGPPSTIDKKKVPMNKVQVGAAPSPNLKTVRSKIGSLDNTSYKPGGGKVKIENRKLDFSKAQPKIAAKNDKYAPSGGDKKITQVKLQWNAKPKVGSLDNATYKPGGGDKKIETVKLDFKDKAKPKVGSKDNAKHVPGGGTVKSPVPSIDNKNGLPTSDENLNQEC